MPTLTLALPRDDDDTSYVGLLAKVDHPDGFLHVEVVEYGAAVERLVVVPVHCARSLAVHPLVPDVSLVLPLVVDPRLLLIRHVLHWNV